MSISLDNIFSYMERYRLTPEEVFVIDLLFLAGSTEEHPEYLERYLNLDLNSDFFSILRSLQDKKIILSSCKFPNKIEDFDPETIDFNEHFLHNYRKYSMELGNELLEEYPSVAFIKDKKVSLNNYAKKYNSREEFCFAYGKSIGWKLENHQHVLELIKWAKDNDANLLVVNIADFVISELWRNIEKQKNGDGILYFDNTMDI